MFFIIIDVSVDTFTYYYTFSYSIKCLVYKISENGKKLKKNHIIS